MPIYEYECSKCGRFEVVQKASDKPLKCNPDCNTKGCPRKAKRVVSAAAFHLKGGGWYKTDYATSSSKSLSATPASSSDSSSSDDSSKKKKKDEGSSGTKPKGGCGSGCGCH